MNVGDDKGNIVTRLISDRKPEVMVELGGYVGYSVSLSRHNLSRGKHSDKTNLYIIGFAIR